MEHEEYKEMLSAHALGALDEASARSLEAHLASCDECRVEFEGWRETASALAYTVAVAEPSAGVRSRILEAARHLPQSPGVEKSSESPAIRAKETPDISSKVLPFAAPARRRWTAGSMIGALAASLAFVALLLSLFIIWNRNREMRNELAQLSNRLNQTQEELAREREEKEMLASPEAQTAMLAGTPVAPNARARLTFDKNTGRAMLVAYDLPPAPAGKAYQLWFIAGSHVMPGHVFKPNAQGRAIMNEQIPPEGMGANIFAVTLEPQGGVNSPTGEKYLLSSAS